jgi:hypothetical protein
VFSITIFVAGAIGGWIVSKICDAVWESRLGPTIRKVLLDKLRSDSLPEEFSVRFQVYYEPDQVLVTVRALVRSPEDVDNMVRLVPEAERRALAWLESRGIDCDEVLFTIEGGELTTIPRVLRNARPNPSLQPTTNRNLNAKSKNRSRPRRG